MARPGRPYGARTSDTSCISARGFSAPMKTWMPARPGDAPDELAEVGPVLEGREDLAELVALGELRGLHDVEQAVAEDLLDRRRVVLAQDPDDALADAAGRCARSGSSAAQPRQAASARRRGALGESLVEQAGDAVERRLVDAVGLVEGDGRLLDRALAQDEDEARHPLVDRDEVDPPDVGGVGLGRRREAGRAGQPGERRGGEAEPVLAGELDLAELVADHQLLDRRQRHGLDDRLDVEAVAGVGRHAAGAGVRMGQQAGHLELGEDVADGRAGHAEAVALDERLAADRLCGRDVFLDDGPEDRLGAEVQGAEGAADPTRQLVLPWWLALDR